MKTELGVGCVSMRTVQIGSGGVLLLFPGLNRAAIKGSAGRRLYVLDVVAVRTPSFVNRTRIYCPFVSFFFVVSLVNIGIQTLH